MKRLAAFALCAVFMFSPLQAFAGQGDVDQVLRGIPAIAKAFAPLGEVEWRTFAQVLAGICAVESGCDPTMLHRNREGRYSQYQGLFQMNGHEVTLAEQQIPQLLVRIQQLVASGQVPQEAYNFVRQAVEQANSTSGDRRFLPAYGIILGAAKHIQINKQLAEQYPGNYIMQTAGHLTAQFSGITERKIRARQFNAPISGCATCTGTEAWALSANNVQAQGLTVDGAIRMAANRPQFLSKIQQFANRMAQVTNDMSLIPANVAPFTPPPYQPGNGSILDVPFSGVSTLMESGYITQSRSPYQNYPQTMPRSIYESAQTPGTIGQQPGSNQPASTTPQSSMLLIAQPSTVKTGGSALVSWTSVNMRTGCSVSKNGASFASGSEGAKRETLQSGTVTYKLTCTSQAGSNLESSATVNVQ